MSSTADTFARFLDVVVEGMDDSDLDGDAVAARVHLSRFHFDRMVAAFGGEPPAALRRRIKLERSAYQLLISGRRVIDIAVDAGYGSHEAYTRAFVRAYGRTPSQWRHAPSPSLHIASSSSVHFHPPAGLHVPAPREVTSMDLLQRMIAHHIWVLEQMLERAQTLDDAALDRPIEISVDYLEERPTLRAELARLVGQLDMWASIIDGRDYDWAVESGESVSSMRRRLARAGAEFQDIVDRVVAEGRLDDTFVDAHCEPAEVFTFGGLIAHVLAFGATRRTIAIGALTSAGIDDLGYGDPRVWVATAGTAP